MEDDSFQKGVLKDNGWCADCGDHESCTWASKAFGVTLCLQCAGSHRKMGPVSKVASLVLDKWSKEEEEAFLAKGGNDTVNRSVVGQTPRYALKPSTPNAVRSAYCLAKWCGKDFNLHEAMVRAVFMKRKKKIFFRVLFLQSEASHSVSQSTVHSGILRITLIHGRQLKPGKESRIDSVSSSQAFDGSRFDGQI